MLTFLLGLLLALQPLVLKTDTTEHFLIRHDRNIPAKFIRTLSSAMEAEYARTQKALGIPLTRRMTVVIYTSELRYKSESRSLAFDNGDATGGVIHLSYPALKANRDSWDGLIARTVAKAVTSQVVFCPPWLVDAYSLHAGNETNRFGDPAQVAIASFGDLFEEYNRAERPREVKEVYAKLGFTIEFLLARFGQKKVRELFAQFRSGKDLETIFTETFGEPVSATEQAWAAELRASARK